MQEGDEEAAPRIAIAGDLQRTHLVELLIGRAQNDVERRRIIAAVANERPSLIVLLGDMVCPATARQWRLFDELTRGLRAASAPILPVVGNHDLQGLGRRRVLRRLHARFPHLAEGTWYRRRHGELGMVWLDSNRRFLGPEAWRRQKTWFEEALDEYDRALDVRAVVVFVHHAPFSNSLTTGDQLHVQRAFLEPFCRAGRTIAMFGGHSHAYERFVKDGKHFVVSGGGGGPRAGLRQGFGAHDDLFAGPSPRPFHYLVARPDGDRLQVVAKGFDEGEEEFRILERFEIPYPTASER